MFLRIKGAILVASLVGIPLAVGHAVASTGQNCTRAYGECEVTEIIYQMPNGVHQVFSCYAQPAYLPGGPSHSDVWVGREFCEIP